MHRGSTSASASRILLCIETDMQPRMQNLQGVTRCGSQLNAVIFKETNCEQARNPPLLAGM
jgi:hypothetical protein